MKRKSCCSMLCQRPVTRVGWPMLAGPLALALFIPVLARAGDAPEWMHAQVSAKLPAYDEKTDAILLYSETSVTVQSADKIKTQYRRVYKILRPGGRSYGTVYAFYRSPGEKINNLHGWCIPAQGKDYEVKEKDAVEASIPGVDGSELISDVKAKLLRIPAAEPGNIVGYEYELEEQPLVLQDTWRFQSTEPARESRYSVQLPAGWEYKASWLNYPEVKPAPSGANQWRWTVTDVKGIREEQLMPPMQGVVGQMILSFFPASGTSPTSGFADWAGMGNWYSNLVSGRTDASPQIKQQVAALTASQPDPIAKAKALSEFVQRDIRYVAIELGIGGWQPHSAPDVFSNRYGDCKDKVTLLRSMLHEVGINSFHVAINTERGSVTPETPAHNGFNHAILAIKLPEGTNDPSLVATLQDPKLGMLLFFDPTDEMTPFGQIRGELQANYGLLVAASGGELVKLPQQPAAMNSIRRKGSLTLDEAGTLKGDVIETRMGDRATYERWRLRTIKKDSDRLRPIEDVLAASLSNFQVTHAAIVNGQQTQLPFGFNYSFESPNYAKSAGGLLLVRPRVLGTKSQNILETKDPRKFPIEFEGPVRDEDHFEIAIPAGYEVDDLPPPVDSDYGFASYHSKTEAKDGVIRYSRIFEVSELSVPVSKADQLKKFYRIIANDERNTVVLKPRTH
jgi:hypothetical protein